MNVKKIHLLLSTIAGLWLVSVSPPTAAELSPEPWQLAQGETLPPLPFGNEGIPSNVDSFPSVVVPQEFEFQVEPTFTNPDFTNDRTTEDSKFYLVYIPGENRQTLEKVRLYEPDAFFVEYKGRTVIQAGIFADRYNAERLAREMEFGGVRSAISTLKEPSITVAETLVAPAFTTPPVGFADNLPPVNAPIAPPTAFNPSVAPLTVGEGDRENGYFVVIPGNPQEFPMMIQEAIDAGMDPSGIFTRDIPFGPHVAIGPFPDRVTAEQESGYLQRFGLDARTYFVD